MASLSEIKDALLKDPGLLDRVPQLKEYVTQYPEEFGFLFKKNKNKNGQISPPTTGQREVKITEDQTTYNKRWNPRIEAI